MIIIHPQKNEPPQPLLELQAFKVSPRVNVFPNLRRTHEYENFPFSKQLFFKFLASFSFHRKQIFPLERGNIKVGELPPPPPT
jgi:hypothetical protein